MKESSSSEPTAQSETSRGVLELGQALVAELGLDTETDTLARWMAHYIAELLEAAKASGRTEGSAEHVACAQAILALW